MVWWAALLGFFPPPKFYPPAGGACRRTDDDAEASCWMRKGGATFAHPIQRRDADPCACTAKPDRCFSNGVDVRPFCGCDEWYTGNSYSWCYTVGRCTTGGGEKVVGGDFSGAYLRGWCDSSPPPPPHPHGCGDPLFGAQWHHPFLRSPEAWALGANGTGVHVAVVDDGLQYKHPELDVVEEHSFGWDRYSTLVPTANDDHSIHGTAVAGVITARAGNQRGGCGVAHGAKLIGVQILNNSATSALTDTIFVGTFARLASYPFPVVMSNSWGPPDDGRIDGPGHRPWYGRVADALSKALRDGRGALGLPVVFAAGNGGGRNDNSNDDGFQSHPYTISVGSVGDDEKRSPYSEFAACLDVVAPSSSSWYNDHIVTADLVGYNGYSRRNRNVAANHTLYFGGTSAAAPQVSAVVALILGERPQLSVRDLKGILWTAARKIDASDESWTRNAAGHWFSPWYGFGAVDAERSVRVAKAWQRRGVGWEVVSSDTWSGAVPLGYMWTTISVLGIARVPFYVETVSIEVDVQTPLRGEVEMRLVSPAGTKIPLTKVVTNANFAEQAFVRHAYLVNGFFDEEMTWDGWKFEARDELPATSPSTVRELRLHLYGSQTPPPVVDEAYEAASPFPPPAPPTPAQASPPPPPPPPPSPTPASSSTTAAAWAVGISAVSLGAVGAGLAAWRFRELARKK